MLILDLLYVLLLLLLLPFWLKYVLKKSYRQLLKSRLRPQLPPRPGKTVWIHAVSVGEVRSLRSLITALGEKKARVVLSVTTPAGFAQAGRNTPASRCSTRPSIFLSWSGASSTASGPGW